VNFKKALSLPHQLSMIWKKEVLCLAEFISMTHHLRTVKYVVVVNGLQMNKDKFVKGGQFFRHMEGNITRTPKLTKIAMNLENFPQNRPSFGKISYLCAIITLIYGEK